MFKQITKNQFEEIMENLQGKPIWIMVKTSSICVNRFFEELEFLSFVSGKYQLGFQGYEEENEHKRLLFKKKDVLLIHRDIHAPDDNAEQIILFMNDGVEIFVEHNC